MTDQTKTPGSALLKGHKGELTPQREDQPVEGRQRRLYSPNSDILETDDEFIVIADLPGVDENQVEVNLDKNILTITAHPTIEVPDRFNLSYSEYIPGDYERRFVLSDLIDREKIEANVKNGVLQLHLPKAGHAKPRRISVRSG